LFFSRSYFATGPGFSFNGVIVDVLHVTGQVLKDGAEFLLALIHIKGNPDVLIGVAGLGNQNLTKSLGEQGTV
jgi:hypothetical protein